MAGPSIVWLDGFELSDPPQTLWTRRYSTAAALVADVGRDDTGRALSYQSIGMLTLVLPVTGVLLTPVIGFGFKFNDLLTNDLIVMKRGGVTTAALRFVRDSAGAGHLAIVGSATHAEMPIGSMVANRFYYVELQAVLTNTGRFELRIDMIPTLYSTAAVDMQAAGSPGADAWEIQSNGASSASVISIDDFYLVNAGSAAVTAFLGDIRIQGLMPHDNHLVEYTPLAGTNVENIDDDVPDADTTYNSNPLVAQKTDIIHMEPVDFSTLSTRFIGAFCVVDHRLDAAGPVQVAFLQHDPNDASEQLYQIGPYSNMTYELVSFAGQSRPQLLERQDAAQLHFGYRSG